MSQTIHPSFVNGDYYSSVQSLTCPTPVVRRLPPLYSRRSSKLPVYLHPCTRRLNTPPARDMSRLSASVEESANASRMSFPLGFAPQADHPLDLPRPDVAESLDFPSLGAMPPHFSSFDLWHSEKLFRDVIPIIETQKRRIKKLEGQLQLAQTQLSIHKNQRVSELNEMARVKSLFDRVLRDTLDVVRNQNNPDECERAIVMAGYTANLALVLLGSLPSPPDDGLCPGDAANEDVSQALERDHSQCSTCQPESSTYSIHLPSTPIHPDTQRSNVPSPGESAYISSHFNSSPQPYAHQPHPTLFRESLPEVPSTSLFRSIFDWHSSPENSDSESSAEFPNRFSLPYVSPLPQHTQEEIDPGTGCDSFAHFAERPSRAAPPLSPLSNFSILRGNSSLGQEPPSTESHLELACECNDWNPFQLCLCSKSLTYERDDVNAQEGDQEKPYYPLFHEPGCFSSPRVLPESPAFFSVPGFQQIYVYEGLYDESEDISPKRKRASTSELDQSPKPSSHHRLFKQQTDTGSCDWSPAAKQIKLESPSP